MRQRLLAAGFAPGDLILAGSSDRKQNLIARFRGSGKAAPILIFAHLDVVEAERADWSTDPFKFIEKDGYYYGRGTQDIKDNVAIAVETFIRLKREKYAAAADLILMLTADEEAGPVDGMDWLLEHRPELFRGIQYGINLDSGDINQLNGKTTSVDYEASEKTYADFELTATDRGGHSSLPHAGNPIERLASGLTRLQAVPFPAELNAVTRSSFAREAQQADAQTRILIQAALRPTADQNALDTLANNSTDANALLRTTCVPTRIAGGEANNALPEGVTVNINCRILPGHSAAETKTHIVNALADDQIHVQYCSSQGKCGSAPDTRESSVVVPREDVLKALEKVSAEFWPGVPVFGEMENWNFRLRISMRAGIATYGMTAVGVDAETMCAPTRKMSRLRITSFNEGVKFFNRFIRELDPPAHAPER